MTRHPLKAAMAVLVIVISTACGASSPTAPPPTPVPPAPTVLSISSLPYDEATKDYIWVTNIMGHGGGQKTVRLKEGLAARYFGEGLAKADVQKAVNLWAPVLDGLHSVTLAETRAEANFIHRLEYPIAGLQANECAQADPNILQYNILDSIARYALGAKDGCKDRSLDWLLIAHEMGHDFGLKEHTKGGDIMSDYHVGVISNVVRDAVRWIHSVPAATPVVR